MAARRVTVRDCDLHDGDAVAGATYAITYPDGVRVTVDLCDEDAAPLERLRGVGKTRRARRVVSVEAVTAMRKKTAAPKAAKKATRRRA